jgi:putative flippase GtrA
MRGLSRRVFRFALVGVVNTVVNYAFYLTLVWFTPYLIAHVVAFSVATIGSYFLNCRFTFHTRPSLHGLLMFPLSSMTNFVVSTAGLYVLVEWCGVPQWLAPVPVAAVAVPVTFAVADFLLARQCPEQGERPASRSRRELPEPTS